MAAAQSAVLRELLRSRTFWIAALGLAYVLLTGDVTALRSFHLDDHTTTVIIAIANVVNIASKALAEHRSTQP